MSRRREDDGDSPAWIEVIPPDEAEGDLAEAYREIGARERVANVIGLHALHPAGMRAHVELYRTLMFGPSPLSRAQRESLAVVVSAANDCFY